MPTYKTFDSFSSNSSSVSKRRSSSVVKFVVVGDGDSRSIIGYDSSISSSSSRSSALFGFSATSSFSEFGPTRQELPSPWECPRCSHVNADGRNPKCSMCGKVYEPTPAAVVDDDDEDGEQNQEYLDDSEHTTDSSSRMIKSLPLSSSSSSTARRRLSAWKDKSVSIGSLLAEVKEEEELDFEESAHKLGLIVDNEPDGAWTCTACTYVNTDPMHLSCEICGTEKPKEALAGSAHDSIREFLSSRTSFSGASSEGQSDMMEEQIRALREFEQRSGQQQQLDAIIEHQRQLMDELTRSQNIADSGEFENATGGAVASDIGPDEFETLQQTRLAMERSSNDIMEMESIHMMDKRDQDAMEAILMRRKAEIESEESITLTVGPAVTPGVQSVSSQAHQWKAQMRMLQQWRHQWNLRDQELRQIRQLHDSNYTDWGVSLET